MMQKLLMLLLLRNYFMKEVNGKIKNGGWFGNKLNNYQPLLNNGVNPFTGDSFEEIVGELKNMANIYRYDNLTNTPGIYQDPIGGYRLSINGNVKVKGDLCFYKKVQQILIVWKI